MTPHQMRARRRGLLTATMSGLLLLAIGAIQALTSAQPANATPVSGTASLGNFVWEDLNGNGVQDGGEPGIPGIRVELVSVPAATFVALTTTDAAGAYLFTSVAPGTYQVWVTLPAGYYVTIQDAGVDDAVDSDVNGLGQSPDVTVAADEYNPTVDAGLVYPASLGDYVWEDLNGDGIQDLGEPGVPGATVELRDSSDNVVDTVVTDANGFYTFTDLWPGAYYVNVTIPPTYVGFGFTTQGSGVDDSLDSDADLMGDSPLVALESGEYNDTVDAGLVDIIAPEFLLSFDPALGDLVVEGVDDGGTLPVSMSGGGFFRTYTIEDTAGNTTVVKLLALKFGFGRVFFWLNTINYNGDGEQPIYGKGLFYSSGFDRQGALSNFIAQVRAANGPSYMAGFNGTTTFIYGGGSRLSLPGFVSLIVWSEDGTTYTGYDAPTD